MQSISQRGAIYIAIGKSFFQEACISVESLKTFHPELPVTLFTDQVHRSHPGFEQIVPIRKNDCAPHRAKLVYMPKSPYRDTLFLDTDTFICGDIAQLFQLLDSFDLAASIDRGYTDAFPPDTKVPDAFCELNNGVAAYRKSEQLISIFEKSLQRYDKSKRAGSPHKHEQVSLRIELYESALRIAPLTQEYNCRYPNWGYLSGSVKILHGRPAFEDFKKATLQRIAQRLNKTTLPRVFVAGSVIALAKTRIPLSRPYQAKFIAYLYNSRWPYLIRQATTIFRKQGLRAILSRIVRAHDRRQPASIPSDTPH